MIALASAEGVQELQMQASKQWTVGRETSADDGHGRLQLTPHVWRRERVCNEDVNGLLADAIRGA